MNEIHIKSDAKYIDIHHNDVVNVDISTKEPVSEELEEVAKINVATMVLNGIAPDATVEQLREVAYKCFINGANWQKQKDYKKYAHVSLQDIHDAWQELIKNIPDIRSMPAVCFARGADWQKQQLMKDAIDASAVYYSGEGTLFSPEILPDYVNPGDKVKLIITKED